MQTNPKSTSKMNQNTPYVKQYDADGIVTNPIIGSYPQAPSQRKSNRSSLSKERFHGESKNHHLTVSQKYAYKRVKQIEYDKEGNRKVIFHYLIK